MRAIHANVRLALSLGMLLGMTHGWVISEGRASQSDGSLEFVKTVKSATLFRPFGSDGNQSFPY